MRIILLRHAETAGNREQRYIGRTDEPLNDFGIRQAMEAGPLKEIKRVYLSPLQRAKKTAEICFPEAEYIFVSDLREMDFGAFEKRTAEEMKDDPSYIDWVAGGSEGKCPNGESLQILKKRVQAAFRDLVEEALLLKLEQFAIVTHGGCIMAIMDGYTSTGKSYFSWHIPNCQGYELLIEEDQWQDKHLISSYRHFEQLNSI